MSIRLTRPRWLVHQSRNRSHFYVASSHYQQYRLLFVRVNLAMTDSTVQQSHSENLRRIEAAKDKFEKRIRSLESRIEERSHNLDGRLNLLDRRLLSISTRIDNRVDPCVQRSSERVNIVESQTFKKKYNETSKRLVQNEVKWQWLARRCYRRFRKLEADLTDLRTSLRR